MLLDSISGLLRKPLEDAKEGSKEDSKAEERNNDRPQFADRFVKAGEVSDFTYLIAKRTPKKSPPKEPDKKNQSGRLDSDVTVEELYKLRQNRKIQYIFVIFHSPGCTPCKVIKTPEYQKKISEFNRKNPKMKIVTMDIGDTNDKEMDQFMATIQLKYVPYVLNIQNRDGKFYLSELTDEEGKKPDKLKKDLNKKAFEEKGSLQFPPQE